MIRRPLPILVMALVISVWVSGCASRGPTVSSMPCALCQEDPDSPKVLAAYTAALAAAQHPGAQSIAHNLTPLRPGTPGLLWNDDGKILMSTWSKAKYYTTPEGSDPEAPFPLGAEVWFTPAHAVQDFCRNSGLEGSALTLRLEQRIGLPPDNGKDSFIELWIDPKDLFRPCIDDEITDRECRLDAPRDEGDGQAPWDCNPEVTSEPPVNPNHRQWMCDNWAGSFGNEELTDNYPWTALGYTFDWGNPNDPRGFSEFVAPVGTEAVLHAVVATADYCAR